LRGLAFHPKYGQNGYFYVTYTYTSGDVTLNRISRFQVSADPNRADPDSEQVLLTVIQPYTFHNAGEIHFGPDGYLYILLGDGGSYGDSQNNAQIMSRLLGKVARIDVNAQKGSPADCKELGSGNYTIPPTNPFVDGAGKACDEIWSMGLRAPWRFSFDRLTGDLYMGDVGQDAWEEINFQPRGSAGGENYGWRCYEGNHPYNTDGCQAKNRYTFPIFEYSSQPDNANCAVITGYVYRGAKYPAMHGHFFLTDFCSGIFWDLACGANGWQVTQHTNLLGPGRVAFGEDAQGELYVVNIYTDKIYRLVESTPVTPTVTTPAEDDTRLYLPIIMKPLFSCS
jgi:glucose/arabinose dehydrogenase